MLKTRHRYQRHMLNQLFNLFWTLVCFTPIFWFWYLVGAKGSWLYIATGLAMLFALVPAWVLERTVLSEDPGFYERYGVRFMRKFVQDGDIVNSMTKENRPAQGRGKAHAKRYLSTIAMYERYHWTCMVFFLLSTVIAFLHGFCIAGTSILAANFTYNAIPIFLQQYNKVRIKKITDLQDT